MPVSFHTHPMDIDHVLEESNAFAEELLDLIDLPLFDDSPRLRGSDIACSLALEHWHAVRSLLQGRFLPSALVTHRAQFESILRSVWLVHAASDSDVAKLTASLDAESEQAAKNAPQVQQMMDGLARSGPKEAHAALARFKNNSWRALNSYAHAGIHPLRRHADGYPVALAHAVLCNANGLGVLCGMQAASLSGVQAVQREVLGLAAKHPSCMPPSL